ncbi:restriction endonuclease subunit S [Paraburkholderia agricolaris]|uniref:Restriction endonuclease subunit S n=2 Tax=Paraburkholderia agricolaris TaxID=2152888 RepID=A0ABW8ZSI9_9BURK
MGVIGDFVTALRAGVSVNAVETESGRAENEVGVLKTGAVLQGKFYAKQHKIVVPEDTGRVATSVVGDRIIISRMNTPALVGESGYVPEDVPNLFLPDRLWQTEPSARPQSQRWLSYWLQHPSIRRLIAAGATGTSNSMKNISKETVLSLPVPLTPLPEQKKIAATLAAVDDKLDVITRQIESTETLKQGMMQVLFSRGVGTEDTDGGWLPHTEFMDSELGEIPVGWNVLSLSDVVDNLDKHRIPLKQSDRALRKGEYPYYGASGVIDWIDEFIFDGDFILLGEDGENVVSRNLPLAFRATGKIWVNNHAHVFQPKSDFDIQFLVELLESIDYSHLASGTAQPKITQQALRQLRFAVPPYAEQRRIGAVLAALESKLALLRDKLDNYQTLKSGLMQKLLTGEWRVKVETAVPEAEPEVTA